MINLATFAFSIYGSVSFRQCIKAFFVYIVPTNTYTTEEIQLYFGLKLAYFQGKIEEDSSDVYSIIDEVFPEDEDELHLNTASPQTQEIIDQNENFRSLVH